nr:hypothetical protein [Tanacetum cinerariifolium]
MILSGADNRPPMLDKDLYDSWKSRMELYIQNIEQKRMILESVKHGPLICPTIKENRVTRTKKYVELSTAKKIHVDCDMKATNIIFQGLPADVYSLVNHHRVSKDLWERVQLLMQGTSLTEQERECKLFMHILNNTNSMQTKSVLCVNASPLTESPLVDSGLVVPVFSLGDDLISCLNKAMAFLTAGHSATNLGETRAKFLALVIRVMLLVLGETMQVDKKGLLNVTTVKLKDIWLGNALSLCDQGMLHGVPDGQVVQSIIPNNAAFRLRILILMILTMMISQMQKRFSWPIFSTMVLTLSQRLTEDFRKCFTPQQELSTEQAFWLRMSDPTSKPSDALPVKIEAPKELSKISLVNESL